MRDRRLGGYTRLCYSPAGNVPLDGILPHIARLIFGNKIGVLQQNEVGISTFMRLGLPFHGGSRGLQAPNGMNQIKVALAAGISFMLPKCGSLHKKLVRTS